MSNTDIQSQIEVIEKLASRYREQTDLEEIRAKGFKVEIYFDTYHILHMVQGYWELPLDTYDNVDTANFFSNRFLVKCLVYFKFIKGIKLLLPHAIELGMQLDKNYLLPSHSVKSEAIEKFLNNIHFDSLDELIKLSEENKLEEYLRKIKTRSEDIFKANYVLSELKWNSRYNYLMNRKDPVVKFDDAKYNNLQILQSNLFHEIMSALENMEERKNKTVNNLRDAMALCMFYKKIQQFRADQVLPLFYISGGVLSKLPIGITQKFIVKVGKKKEAKTVNLLKDSEFFILDSMFTQDMIDIDDTLYKNMRHLKHALKFYSSDNTFLDNDIATITASWQKFKENDFFEKLWNPERGSKKVALTDTIKDLLNYRYIVNNDQAFRRLIEQDRESIKNTLTEKISDLVFLEEIWLEVDTFDKFIENKINRGNKLKLEDSDIFKDEGLTRFSPPTGGEIESNIKEIWKGFLEHYITRGRQYQAVKVKLTQILYDGCIKAEKKDCDKILTGISILWAFQRYSLIIKIVDRLDFNYGDRYQIGLIMLASMIKRQQKTGSSANKMHKVIRCIETQQCFAVNYKAWIGLAYIKFNIWRIYCLDGGKYEKYGNYLTESIKLNKKAFMYLEDKKDEDNYELHRNVKFYYSLNNFIYYTIKGIPDELANPLFISYIKLLQNGQSSDDYKQPRFSDTIALYYFISAQNAISKERKMYFITRAETYSKEAIELSRFRDETFEEHLDEIILYKDEIEKM